MKIDSGFETGCNMIKITEEELIKLGFERTGNLDTWFGRACWNKGDIVLMHGYGSSTGGRTKYKDTEVDYVHELIELIK